MTINCQLIIKFSKPVSELQVLSLPLSQEKLPNWSRPDIIIRKTNLVKQFGFIMITLPIREWLKIEENYSTTLSKIFQRKQDSTSCLNAKYNYLKIPPQKQVGTNEFKRDTIGRYMIEWPKTTKQGVQEFVKDKSLYNTSS